MQTAVAGEIDLSITYDPFGAITSGVDENFVGYAYNAEETNAVIGLQYLRARYYDTDLGAFITIDAYLGSLTDVTSQNRYTYANNDPVNNIDPSGHSAQTVAGMNQYYQSTGLNQMRDEMTAFALYGAQINAQNSFSGSVAKASNTSMFNYQSITGISQATANGYINKGIARAGQVSMNYGCTAPTVPNVAVAKFTSNINAAKNTANNQIDTIKAQKKQEYDEHLAYQEYLRKQEEVNNEKSNQSQNGISDQNSFIENSINNSTLPSAEKEKLKNSWSGLNTSKKSAIINALAEAGKSALLYAAESDIADKVALFLSNAIKYNNPLEEFALFTTANTVVTSELSATAVRSFAKGAANAAPFIGGAIDFTIQVATGEDVVDAAIKSAAHVAIGVGGAAAGTYIGGLIGSFIPLPGIGTVIGMGIGFVGGMAFDYVYDNWEKIGSGISDTFKTTGNAISGFFGNIGKSFGW